MTDVGVRLAADVLVIGAGAAGMMAARAASDQGASVVLVDKSLIGRGGATVLAQMTVAVALGEAEPDSPELHAADTIQGGRGLADPSIVQTITDAAPAVIRDLEAYGTPWARAADGTHSQVAAPGHSRQRCVYVDVLRTGEGVSAALRRVIWHDANIVRLRNVTVTRLVREQGIIVGAVGFALEEHVPVSITTPAVIIATGGTTQLYARTSASATMTGDGLMLAALAGAELRDMEMVQFFPIAHLFPPLVQLDPIMWDPFRYKLGGRLLNGNLDEFMHRYTSEVSGRYTAMRDQTTRAIFDEVQAGRGSPHGGAYLDFRQVPVDALEQAFGPVITILGRQGIDLTKDMVEVAPMAHFMLGGIRVDPDMRTGVEGLFACGEAICGMHGANRLSGNAITEAVVTGKSAGGTAAQLRTRHPDSNSVVRASEDEWARLEQFWHPRDVRTDEVAMSQLKADLQQLMWEKAGPLRTEEDLQEALRSIQELRATTDAAALAREDRFALSLLEKVELQHMLRVGEAIVRGALARRESRGAHVRLDYPETAAAAVGRAFFFTEAEGWTLHDVSTPAGVMIG